MIFLVLLLWASPGLSLEIELELGWGKRPVLDAINPLWVTLTNPGPDVVQGELRLTMEFGSPWRGIGTYSAWVSCAVGPRGKTRLVLPWPVRAGGVVLRAAVLAGARRLAEKELRISPDPESLRAGIGPPTPGLDLLLSPAELPADPLLLSPFSEVRVLSPLSGRAEDVVRAWQAFLGGAVRVDEEALRGHLGGRRPPPPDWALLVPGLFLYVLCLVWALPGWAQGRPQLALAFLLVFWAFSLFYSVSRGSVPQKELVEVRIERPGFTGFGLELLGIAPWAREEVVLEGWWAELLPARDWQGRDLLWRFTGDAWQTVLRVQPGVPRVLLRIGRAEPQPGEETPPPAWLLRALALPWERAKVRRAPLDLPAWTRYVVRLS